MISSREDDFLQYFDLAVAQIHETPQAQVDTLLETLVAYHSTPNPLLMKVFNRVSYLKTRSFDLNEDNLVEFVLLEVKVVAPP